MDSESLGDTIFNRLYKTKSSPNILSPFRRRDPRDSTQKEYESHCTFRPVINGESPFISERTIRSVKSKGQYSIQPTPIQRNGESSTAFQYRRLKRIKDSYHNSQISSGLYTKDRGFIPGPPVDVGLPLYYFNPAYPPPFSLGYYSTSSNVGEDDGLTGTKVVKSQPGAQASTHESAKSNELAPPPLPPWALGPRDASQGASKDAQPKKISIVITKKEKKDDVPAAAEGGWKALLAELQKRTSGLSTALKKPVEVKAAPVPQKKKKTKKKQEFKDVMEEMKYKLAKRNGEIVEEDDDEEEEGAQEAKAPPPPLPPPPVEAPSNSSQPADAPNSKNLAEGKESLAITVDSNDSTLGDKGGAFSASTDSVGGPLSSTSSKSKKVFSKPDLSSILAKVKPPAESVAKAAAPAAEEKPPESNVEEAPVKNKAAAALNKLFAARAPPPAAPPSEPKPAAAPVVASAPKLASSPPPPPPPVPTSWPPIPVVVLDLPQKQPASVGDAAQQKSEPISQSNVAQPNAKSSQSVQDPLPEGYYLAQPEEGMVEPGLYTRAGCTTQELCLSMQRSASLLQNQPSDDPELIGLELVHNPSLSVNPNQSQISPDLESGVAYDGFESQHKQLAMSDLPLPGNFYHSVEHIRKGREFRLAQQEKLRQLELRNFLSDPIPTANSGKESVKPATARSTTPSQFVSHVDLHYENKAFSFRKPVESTNRSEFSDGPPVGGGKRTNLIGNMYTPSGEAVSSVAPATVAWMNNLRGPSTTSHTLNSTRMRKENSRSARNFNDTTTEFILPDDNASTRNAINYFAKASRKEVSTYSNSSNSAYTDNNNNSTRPSGKKLLVDDLIDRRNLIREERKKMEADAEAERIKAEKLRKALLKDRALRNTHTKPQLHYLTEGISPIMSNLGPASQHDHSIVSNSSNNHQRFAYHKKMIDKYKNVTGSVDLERMAASAYTEYSRKHLNKKNDYIYSATPSLRNRPGPSAADVYRDLEREFEEYDDQNINTFKFIDR